MVNKKNIIILLVCIFITALLILFLLNLYYFKWHENSYLLNNILNNKNSSYLKTKYTFFKKNDTKDNLNTTDSKDNIKINESKLIDKDLNIKNQSKNKTDIVNKNTTNVIKNNINDENIFAKGSNLPDQNFHSYGDYVSNDEKTYRQELIKNLKIKTIIIDKLTKGNGISQEYFRVAYINKMIPAKILELLVESEEFRKLIPKKYLNKEIKTKGLSKGDFVIIKNEDIKTILILWTLGRLTPIQKAWAVNAVK